MIFKDYYWYFKSALSHKFCDDLISYAKTKEQKEAFIGHTQKIRNKKTRNSNVVWLDDPWIYKEIHPYIHHANQQAGWNFEWDYSETCQFTKYGKGQHYDWHCDSFNAPYKSEDINFNNKIRKLSVTCSLSDSKDYKGGELEFQFRDTKDAKKTRVCKEILSKGSIVVFPSHVWHRVKPVTKGTRYSLVLWNLGYPFK